VLVGDSGQDDPEIYAAVIREHPGRIHAAYIRDVGGNETRSASVRTLATELARDGATLLLAEDTLAAARHAAEHGWIDAAALRDVEAEVLKDA
jgi:phosphatidate phosphatase APP1